MDTWYEQQMPLEIDSDKARLGDFEWEQMSPFNRNYGTFNDSLNLLRMPEADLEADLVTWYDQQMPLKIDSHKARLRDSNWKKMSLGRRNYGNFNDTRYTAYRWGGERMAAEKAKGKRKAPEPKRPTTFVIEALQQGERKAAQKAEGWSWSGCWTITGERIKAPEPTGTATAGGKRKAPEPQGAASAEAGGSADAMEVEAEAEAERPSKKQMVNEDVITDFRPWQKSTVDWVFDPERNDRHIIWVHGPKGMGKSELKKHFKQKYGAQILTPDVGTIKDVKCLVADLLDGPSTMHNQKFRANPILVVDIPLANEKVIQRNDLYMTLEEMQGPFCSTKYKPRNVDYGDKTVAIVVFANHPPSVKHLSTDRLQVYKINGQTFEMRKDLDFDAKIKQREREQEKLDAEREAAIDRAEAGLAGEPPPAPVDLKKYFESGPDQCYKLANAATKKIKAKDEMLEALRRKGYRGDLKQMNAWIRKTYGPFEAHATEKDTKLSKTHPHVKEKKPSNVIAFEGFVRV